MTKIKAAGTHFLLSALIISLSLVFIYYIWYDQIYIGISGVLNPIKILILVDVVLGPLLTFIVFKQGKKSLKFDLSSIVLVQVCALLYGLYSINLGKPCLLTFRNNSFEMVSCKSLNAENTNAELSQHLGIFKKPYISKIENSVYQKNQSILLQLDNVRPLNLKEIEYMNYVPAETELFPSLGSALNDYSKNNLTVPSPFLSDVRIEAISARSLDDLKKYVQKLGYDMDQLKFVMLTYEADFYIAILDLSQQKIIKILERHY